MFTNFTPTGDFTNPKFEIQIEITEAQIIGIEIYFLIKNISSV